MLKNSYVYKSNSPILYFCKKQSFLKVFRCMYIRRRSVSYTHLDVYKRQYEKYTIFIVWFRDIVCCLFEDWLCVFHRDAKPCVFNHGEVIETVTTAEDVYKRQVYGDPAFVPITEECPKGQCTNPYGWSKSMLEQISVSYTHLDVYKRQVKNHPRCRELECRQNLRL